MRSGRCRSFTLEDLGSVLQGLDSAQIMVSCSEYSYSIRYVKYASNDVGKHVYNSSVFCMRVFWGRRLQGFCGGLDAVHKLCAVQERSGSGLPQISAVAAMRLHVECYRLGGAPTL